MSRLYIFGSSDDLVEVEGAVSDEFNHYDAKSVLVTVAVDGRKFATVSLAYDHDDDGEWRVIYTSSHDIPAVQIIPARGEDEPDDGHGCPGYSDKAVVDLGDIGPDFITVSTEAVAR